MSQSAFDDGELFTEATEEIKTDVKDALERAEEHLPSTGELLEIDAEKLPVALNSIESELNIDPVENAVTDARKDFLIGQRADAFDDEYVTETEATISQLQETIATLREIETATATLTDGLSTFENLPVHPPEEPPQSLDTEPESDAESETAEPAQESKEATDDSDEEAPESENNEQDETTAEAEQTDLGDSTDG